MDDLAVTDIDCHVTRIADNVSRLCILIADRLSTVPLFIRGTRQRDAKMLIYCHDKIGTISSLGQAGSAQHIRVAQKLAGITYHIAATDARGVGWI